jgi:hypothetical protein
MVMHAHPFGRSGLFFSGGGARGEGPTVFNPLDGLEIEALSAYGSGTGEALIQAAKLFAFRTGYRRVNIGAVSTAAAFYLRLGFHSRYGDEHDAYVMTVDAHKHAAERSYALVLGPERYRAYTLAMALIGKHGEHTPLADLPFQVWQGDDSSLSKLFWVSTLVSAEVATQVLDATRGIDEELLMFPPELTSGPVTVAADGAPLLPQAIPLGANAGAAAPTPKAAAAAASDVYAF